MNYIRFNKFQFHKVRLKGISLSTEHIVYQFQFHKVRLKV